MTAEKRGKRPYTGPLANPRFPPEPTAWPSTKRIREWKDEVAKLEHEGIGLLQQHYCVDDLRDLVLRMARRHVPYFQTRAKKGRTWDSFRLAWLLDAYHQGLVAGMSSRAAILRAARELGIGLRGGSTKNLQNQLARARSLFIPELVRVKEDGGLEEVRRREAPNWRTFRPTPSLGQKEPKSRRHANPDDEDGIVVYFDDE
jgi:hypothetical protein